MAVTLQTAGPGNIDEILTGAFVNVMPGIKDNIFNANRLLKWMMTKGVVRTTGGPSVSHPIMYGTNTTAQAYERYDILDVTPQDGFTRDQWQWRQYSVSITVDGFMKRTVYAGKAKIEDIVAEKKPQAENSLKRLIEQEMFAAAPGAKSLRSLPVIVLGSGSIGDINGTTNTWWASTVTASGSFSAQGLADIDATWNTVSIAEPEGGPELMMSDQASYQFYHKTLTPLERFTDNNMADIGIKNLLYRDTPWTWSNQANSGVIYFLHTNAIEFVIDENTDFLMEKFVKPANQDASSAQLLLTCALVTGNRRKNAKMTGVSA